MKKLFLTLSRRWIGLAVLLAALFATPVGYGLAQDTTRVFIDPPEREVAVGGTTTVDIRIENVTDLFGAEVHLEFEPGLLEVVDADAGTDGVQIQPGQFLSPYFTAQNIVDQAHGKIHFAASQGPDDNPVSGDGVLATITFRAKAVGTSKVKFDSAILANRDGDEISASTEKGKIIIDGGATSTPTHTPTPTSTPSGTPTPRTHIVRPGEWLYCIARAYGIDPKAIAQENGILNPNLIYPGQALKIPDKPSWWYPGTVCQRQFDGGTPSPTCRWYHTVALGETLYSISVKYGVSMWAIAEANHILNLNYIRAGQVLCIP